MLNLIHGHRNMALPFGAFLPDLPALNNPGTPYVKNVIPSSSGYLPFPSLSVTSVDATTGRPQGAFSGKKKNGEIFTVIGDATTLYQLDGVNLTDISETVVGGDYDCPSEDIWNFVQFDTRIIGVNINDDIQSIDVESDTEFSKHVTSTLEPTAKYIAVIGEFPVIAHTKESGTLYTKRVRWPKINDATDFDESTENQSDRQDLLDGGEITGLVGNKEYGVVLTEDSLHRMDYQGGSIIFSFSKIEGSKGTQIPASVIGFGRDVCYYSPEGFMRYNGVESVPIGTEKLDTFFVNDLDFTSRHRITAAADPERKVAIWAYPGAGNVGGRPNKALIYRWDINRWGYAEVDVELLFRSFTQGLTLDDLDSLSTSLDALAASLDSNAYAGGRLALAGCNSDYKVGFFKGAALDAVIDTAEFSPTKNSIAYVDSVRPLVDGDGDTVITVEDLSRDLQSQKNPTANGEVVVEPTGEAYVERSARYHRFRIRITGGFTHAIGIDDIDAQPDGEQ